MLSTAPTVAPDGRARSGEPEAQANVSGFQPTRSGGLDYFWDRPVRELVTLQPNPLTEAEQERHRLYGLLVMSLVHLYWNGNRYGPRGVYPLRPGQLDPDSARLPAGNGLYVGGEYLGHNIAAIAVDRNGWVVDFDFNHNELFNNSAEHAEARLLRRVFSLSQMNHEWRLTSTPPGAGAGPLRPLNGLPPATYNAMLADVTVYTSLESCSQCAGMMTLARVANVVYLQRDPGQNHIGHILRNLTAVRRTPQTKYTAPLPISGQEIGFGFTTDLEAAYEQYTETVQQTNDPNTAFYIPNSNPGRPNRSTGVTAFLCTDAARGIFEAAHKELMALHDNDGLAQPDFCPIADQNGNAANGARPPLTNREVLEEVREFLEYAITNGRRGIGHNL